MTVEKKQLIIIDANSIIHRAFHALPPLTNKKGEPTNAVYGFLLVLFKTLRELKPTFVVAAFDVPGPTFRHEQWREYKAQRKKAPQELYQQIPKVKEILSAFNIPVFEKPGFEADDIIATICAKSREKSEPANLENIILSGDLDNLQLVDEKTRVLSLKKGVKDVQLYDIAAVKERFLGLSPSQMPDFRALKGDPSDNIPGVPGIGEKTAISLIKDFGTIENLYEKLEEPLAELDFCQYPKRIRELLKTHKEQAFFSKILSLTKKDVSIDFDLEKCSWQQYDREKIRKIFETLGFFSLINKLPGLEESRR